ncbi:branched-chain amino acid ABC transporter permease [Halorubrum sp. BOL3-1]|uniref:branched-chain amino acid ABC transporter permease n=1 Tax=Halorubrum sp. BOL3-1 TaxID=2497325 RepID=UPI0010050342|nr:branched-chain amino acid ABC transporter permease [Halorubrum sp. BOL3-1]QAU11937.1 branched-chain amino acid ABC transporter permease [Halorubrum sp. BOL3-1]
MSEQTETPTSAESADAAGLFDRWDALRERESFSILGAIAFVVVFPMIFTNLPAYNGYMSLVELIYIWAIFAIGFDLLLGYTGLLSFGHAVFWGGSAYAAGLFSANFYGEPLLMVLVATATAVVLALIIGVLSLRRGGIYFAILTLAFGQMMYFLALGPLGGITGGEDGFTGVSVEPLLGVIGLDQGFAGVLGTVFHDISYVLFAGFFVLAVAVAVRIVRSPYGTIFQAIAENEQRVRFLGLNVWRYKITAFVLSGAFAGVAGGLHTIHAQYVAVGSLFWITSGDIVIITVLGGIGSVFGPVAGTVAFLYIENIVSGEIAFWLLVLGTLFVTVVWLFPAGIWGIVSSARSTVREQLSEDDS